MLKQLCKHFLSLQPIFMSKTYNHAVTYNHARTDGNLQKDSCNQQLKYILFKKMTKFYDKNFLLHHFVFYILANLIMFADYFQKQPSEVFNKNRCF